jgi:predicted nuclease of predicted toxin-antitoxin system
VEIELRMRSSSAQRTFGITKDADFVLSFLLHVRPAKLWLVSTGNISNSALEQLVVPLIPAIATLFEANSFIELGSAGIVVRA